MASAAPDGYGGGADDHHHHLLHPHHNILYHVPQQSRREKLRFPPDIDCPPPPPPPFAVPPPHHTAASYYYPSSQNPNYPFGGQPSQLTFNTADSSLQISTTTHHPFSLSLSSSPPPPRQHLSDRPVQLGPFTGYAAVLNRSRFLEPARQLLEEICQVSRGGSGNNNAPIPFADPADPPLDHAMDGPLPVAGGGVQQWKKNRLISMIDEVYRRYKQYYQQVQAVITSFESVAGLRSAAPYASTALKVMSKHFRTLKNAISDQLHHMNNSLGDEGFNGEENSGFGLLGSGGINSHRAPSNYGNVRQPHVWRPQRGLPERAVAVLRAWLFEHFLHPYPTDTDKQMLAKQTGLSRNQVSNWFINARVRLWKPMVEEIHSLEMRQLHKVAAGDKNHNSDKHAQLASPSTATSSNNPRPQISIARKSQNSSSRHPHDEFAHINNHIEEPACNFVYNDLSSRHHIGVGEGIDVGGNGGVSLTLGLHQNKPVCLTEPLPLNVIHRFGLEECSDPYVIGSFEGQDRHFGKEIGGHLLHDFVG